MSIHGIREAMGDGKPAPTAAARLWKSMRPPSASKAGHKRTRPCAQEHCSDASRAWRFGDRPSLADVLPLVRQNKRVIGYDRRLAISDKSEPMVFGHEEAKPNTTNSKRPLARPKRMSPKGTSTWSLKRVAESFCRKTAGRHQK